MTIADKLRKFRMEHDLSYRAAAEVLDCSIATLHELEKGKRMPYERTEWKLRKAMEGYRR